MNEMYSSFFHKLNPQAAAGYIQSFIDRTDLNLRRELQPSLKDSVAHLRTDVCLVCAENARDKVRSLLAMNGRMDPQKTQYLTHLKSTKTVVLVWLFTCYAPPCIPGFTASSELWGGFTIDKYFGMCFWDVTKVSWKRFIQIAFTYCPCFVMATSYTIIFILRIRHHFRKDKATLKEFFKNSQVIVMMAIRSLIYMCMSLPPPIAESAFPRYYVADPYAVLWLMLVTWLNLILNPMIYFATNSSMRRMYLELFGIYKVGPTKATTMVDD